MKGIVFTEFLEMVEDKFGFEVADQIVQEANLPSQGIYTAVGTYPHAEMVSLVVNLSKVSQMEIPVLLRVFGEHLFGRFRVLYAHFFENAQNVFNFLSNIEGYIHVEVKKLYPDAELPTFETHRPDVNTLEMIYRSERSMADFAEGLIMGCIAHFGEHIRIDREELGESGNATRFVLTIVSEPATAPTAA